MGVGDWITIGLAGVALVVAVLALICSTNPDELLTNRVARLKHAVDELQFEAGCVSRMKQALHDVDVDVARVEDKHELLAEAIGYEFVPAEPPARSIPAHYTKKKKAS
jgi:hypothetical protein